MKIIKHILIPLTLASLSLTAYALPIKQVTIPFTNQPIFASSYNGLTFNYDMKGDWASERKVVCELKNTYKSWLEFSDGAIRKSHVYGDDQTVILTNSGKTGQIDDCTDVFHADQVGNVRINDVQYDDNSHSTASCHYEFKALSK